MSTPIASSTLAGAGLPITDEAHAPAAVRSGSTAVKQAYASAQGFEEMLLQQLSQSMLQSSGLGGEGGSGSEGEAGSESSASEGGMLTSMLPQALTDGVMRSGGLGLASQLMSSLDPAAGAAVSGASAAGGTAAGGTAAGATVTGASATGTAPSGAGAAGGTAISNSVSATGGTSA